MRPVARKGMSAQTALQRLTVLSGTFTLVDNTALCYGKMHCYTFSHSIF